MRRQDFHYELPESLIAKQPPTQRRDSRLLHLDGRSGEMDHQKFPDLLKHLNPGDLMVFNNTRVIPARVFGQKTTGGKVEILVERVISEHHVLAHTRANKSPKAGNVIVLQDGSEVTVTGRQGALFELDFGSNDVLEVLEAIGHMPLPPYIDREDVDSDKERYQTVYSDNDKAGAVAAPTAGLHFDDELMAAIRDMGVDIAFVTLHVGAGTFQPVKVDDIFAHVMHSEVMEVDETVCEQIHQTRARGGKIVAVGTTSVRCLETAAAAAGEALIEPYRGETDIFIYPGYRYHLVDALLTNFHLPESTLLMLVSAFVGYGNTMAAYKEAVEQKYRFFSYGDAMFINPNPDAPLERVGEQANKGALV